MVSLFLVPHLFSAIRLPNFDESPMFSILGGFISTNIHKIQYNVILWIFVDIIVGSDGVGDAL